MRKVLHDFSIGKYRVLKLDGDLPRHKYNSYVIDGREFAPVSVTDAINCIAIVSGDSFSGKTVEFKQ